jgi:hypothetical protein
MAAIRVRREPKMADLSVILSTRGHEASAEKMRVLTAGINYGERNETQPMRTCAKARISFFKKILLARIKDFCLTPQ